MGDMIQSYQDFILERSTFNNYTDDEIRRYAWLYFLVFVYPNGMESSAWNRDERMGVNFLQSMKELEKERLVRFENDTWYSEDGAEELIYKVFGNPKTITQAEMFYNPSLERIKGKQGYHIETIPKQIYLRNKKKEDSKVMYHLNAEDYYTIGKWYDKYETTDGKRWYSKLSKYVGVVGDLFEDKEYVLYRGIFVEEGNYHKGDIMVDKGMSWTLSPIIAMKFASGNKMPLSNNIYKIEPGYVGIVLKYKANHSEILLDTEWLVNQKHKFLKDVGFPEEYEVVLKPTKKNVRIYQILKNYIKIN